MKTMTSIAAVFALAAAVGVPAQAADRAFTATGTDCTQITWSQEQLAKHPKIGVACKEVVQRNGKTYVKFEGDVKKVTNKGQEVTLQVAQGAQLTVNPPEGLRVNMEGKNIPVRDLRPGDKLTFYVPEDRLVAQLDTTEESVAQAAPITAPVVQTYETPAPSSDYAYNMPRTASTFPLLALFGAIMIILGATITARRWMHRL